MQMLFDITKMPFLQHITCKDMHIYNLQKLSLQFLRKHSYFSSLTYWVHICSYHSKISLHIFVFERCLYTTSWARFGRVSFSQVLNHSLISLAITNKTGHGEKCIHEPHLKLGINFWSRCLYPKSQALNAKSYLV